MTKRAEKTLKDMRRAADAMGCPFESPTHFLSQSIDFLEMHLGDLHIEYLEGDGWGVSCCHEDESWKGWTRDRTLAGALAKAVLHVTRRQQPKGT